MDTTITTIIVVALVATTIAFQSYVVDAFQHRQVILFPLLHHSSTLSTRSFLTRSTTSTSLAEHTLNDDAITSIKDEEDFMEEDGPKSQLLNEISIIGGSGSIRFGFGDSKTIKSKINNIVKDLSGYVLPLDNRKTSQWKLLYTTAPDILGFKGGPLSQLVSIQQNVVPDGNTLELELKYKPSTNIVSLIGSFLNDIQDDRLKQTVQFDYTIGSMNTVNLQLRGTRIESSRFSSNGNSNSGGDDGNNNNNNNNLFSLPTPLPFVGFTIVFNDGDLRIDRTIQGDFLLIYKKE